MGSSRAAAGSPSHAERWLNELPIRWAATGAATGLALAAAILFIAPFHGDNIGRALVLLAIGGGSGLSWLFIGYWAQWSLRAKFAMSPDSAVSSIRNNWLTGAAILAGAPIVFRKAVIELGIYQNAPPTISDDLLQAAIAFALLLTGAFALSTISARGLSRQILKD